MRSDATTGGRVPPMLHIAFAELMRRRTQEMLAGEGRLGMHQGHHILQLVAEAKRSAGLIETCTSPQTAAQGLIQQPAVGHHVNRGIGCFNLHGAERPLPILPNPVEGASTGLGGPETPNQGLHVSTGPPHTKTEGGFPLLAGWQIKRYL